MVDYKNIIKRIGLSNELGDQPMPKYEGETEQ